MTDRELLEAYAKEKSETAFEALVTQYLGLVHSVALRQVGDPHLAEDISQAVFIILARKAPSLGRGVILPGWLHRTTYHVATKALRSELRRRCRHQQVEVTVNDEPEALAAAGGLLDEAIAQLAEQDRAAIVLRFFQKKPLSEVGVALGVQEETAKKRVARAVDKLRKYFSNHGILTSASSVLAILSQCVVEAAPPGLVASVSAAALAKSGASQAAASLAESISRAWQWTKFKWAAGVSLTICLLTTIVYFSSSVFRDVFASRRSITQRNLPSVEGASTAPVGSPATVANAGKLVLRVFSAENGQPLQGVEVAANYWGERDAIGIDLVTDAQGTCEIAVRGREFNTLRAWLSLSGYVPKSMDWHSYEFATLPPEYTTRLERAQTVSGLVVNEDGEPISDAKAEVNGPGINEAEREHIGYHPRLTSFISDKLGRWSCTQVDRRATAIQFAFTHPDYVRETISASLSAVPATNVMVVMRAGIPLRGFVTTANGVPIVDAEVIERHNYGGPSLRTRTEPNGSFVFPHVAPGAMKLEVRARGYETVTHTVEIITNMTYLRFDLKEASAVAAQKRPKRVTVRLAGTVIDADTGEPLGPFKVLLDEARGGSIRRFIGTGFNGRFAWEIPAGFFTEFRLEAEAEGYQPEVSLITKVGEEQPFEFRLRKSAAISGRVILPNGQPAAGADVFLGGRLSGESAYGAVMVLTREKKLAYQHTSSDTALRTICDKEGVFRFKPASGADHVVIIHDTGCASARLEDLPRAPVKLNEWGHVRGVLYAGSAPASNATVGARAEAPESGAPYVPYSPSVQTDGHGRFEFRKVPPGRLEVFRVTDLHPGLPGIVGHSHHKLIESRPGETIQVALGGHGRRVIGRLATAPLNDSIDWTLDLQKLVRADVAARRPDPNKFTDKAEYYRIWRQFDREEIKYYLVTARDGTFYIDDVAPAKYKLLVSLKQPPKDPLDPERYTRAAREIGSLTQEVIVAEAEANGKALDLGVIMVPLRSANPKP